MVLFWTMWTRITPRFHLLAPASILLISHSFLPSASRKWRSAAILGLIAGLLLWYGFDRSAEHNSDLAVFQSWLAVVLIVVSVVIFAVSDFFVSRRALDQMSGRR